MTGRWPPADRSRSRTAWIDLEAVQLRHVDVQEQQVEAALFRQGQRLPAVVRQPHAVAASREQSLQELRVDLVVLGHQDVQRRRGRDRRRGRFPPPHGPGRRRGVAVGSAHHPVDRLEELVLLDRLEQVGVDPPLADPVPVAGAVPRGQQDDPRGGQLGPLADLGGQCQAVGVRHARVEQDQRVRPAHADGVPEGVQGRQPVADRRRLHLPAAQPLLEDVPVGGVVVDDQHWQVAERGRRPDRDLLRWVRLQPEPRREGEGAAPARLALHGDLPAHQGHQPGGDRQSQPGAAVPPRRRAVLLLERPEDPFVLVPGDAHAGVAHGEPQADLTLGCGRRRRPPRARPPPRRR